ncbi:MoaD/ThiS family protein [Propionispora vibrioides]|uniref:Molybdopterin converting factor, small subunit n=1 Tax=Propionispora vibrioides TaxID=112903 RepID=A0A1H8XCZ8_9FIRM|nr:MoaD/ThiS family protein [Propionispora vibrioides]SEP37746.1 Molybdopterin converting factor, small subunit [Propionispora vibrioides]
MQILVNYMTQIKKSVGRSKEVIDIESPYGLKDFIVNCLCVRYEKLKIHIISNNGDFCKGVLIFLNDEKIDLNNDILLSDNDEITIMTPIAGG